MNPGLNIRIAANMAELRRNLAEGKSSIETTTAAMAKLASSLDGSKLEQRAHNIVAAIDKVGGAAKLTATEAARMVKPLDDFIAKADLMGKSVPKDMLATRDALTKVANEADNTDKKAGLLSGTMGRLASAFAIGSLIDRGISAVTNGLMNLARGAVESAGNIVDLSQKTGLSTTAVQQFGFVAEQSGGSIEQTADAVFKLGTNIEAGGAKIERGLSSLGLEYAKIRALKPEQQFDAIMRALASTENPQQRNLAGIDLMGKGYANVAAMVDGYIEAIGKAPVATEAAIKATDDAADAMDRAWKRAEASAINVIGGIAQAWENGKLQERMAAFSFLPGFAQAAAFLPQADPFSGKKGGDVNLSPAPARPVISPEMERAAATYQAAVDKLTGKATRDQIAQLARQVTDAADAGGLATESYRNLGKQMQQFHKDGYVLPKVLDDLRLAHVQAEFATKVHVLTTRELQAAFRDYPSATLVAKTTVSEMTAEMNAKVDTIKFGVEGLGTLITTLPAPPPDHFQPWKDGVSATFEGFKQDLGGVMHAMVYGWDNAWQAMKQMGLNVLHSLLQAAIDQFLTPLLAAWGKTLAQMATGTPSFGGLPIMSALPGVGGAVGSGLTVGGVAAGAGLGVAAVGGAYALGKMGYEWATAAFGDHQLDPVAYQALEDARHANQTDYSGNITNMAHGGIVRARRGGTVVRVGEAGRDEAIVPLPSGMGRGGGRVVVENVIVLNGEVVSREVARGLPEALERMGVRV